LGGRSYCSAGMATASLHLRPLLTDRWDLGISLVWPPGCPDLLPFRVNVTRFAHKEALQEIHRVLKPGGKLGIIYNVDDCESGA
jgi:SAM-dependent methyltransferase